MPADKGFGIDLRILSFYLENSANELSWVAGSQQLADGLTKRTDDWAYLGWAMNNARYHFIRDDALQNKVLETMQGRSRIITEQVLSGNPAERKRQRMKRKSASARARQEAVVRWRTEAAEHPGAYTFERKGLQKSL